MPSIHELRDQLIAARADAQTHCVPYNTAVDASNLAKRRANELRQLASEAPHVLGIFPGRAARVLATEAEVAQAQAQEHSERASSLSSQVAETALRVSELERQVGAAEAEQEIEDEDPVAADLDRELWRSGMAAQRVHDAVENDQLAEEEAYADDGLIRTEVYDRELRQLEADDDLFDAWAEDPEAAEAAREQEIEDEDPDDSTDDSYAEAAADALEDQLAVRDLDLSIDTGERTHEEVYTPEGHIRQDLLSNEEPEHETPEAEPEAKQQEPPSRDRGGVEFDEPF